MAIDEYEFTAMSKGYKGCLWTFFVERRKIWRAATSARLAVLALRLTESPSKDEKKKPLDHFDP